MFTLAMERALVITSPANLTVKRVRSLRQRKGREETGCCFVEGIRLVAEAARAGVVEQLVVAPELLSSPFARDLVAAQARAGADVIEVSAEVFASLSQKDGPQGLGAVARQRWVDLNEITLGAPPGWVALVEPADPGNLGTIIRTADGVGAAGVIIVGPGADPYDPAALRASMGAAFALGLARATWEELVAWRAATGAYLVGTSDQAPTSFQAVTYPQPLVLLMGSERQGLSPAQQAACDLIVGIPMRGRGDSLNLAVATGVMLYELLRQAPA
jgi:TrmH family RNA methyltransferase